LVIHLRISSIACLAPRFGQKPKDPGRKLASNSGSITALTAA
jgi:hypothetical protein